ncbi:MAG: ABC-2 family transporter protein [Bacilli bacterium]|nr:ABC-2 family transporter protein [Bacilli bacterium]
MKLYIKSLGMNLKTILEYKSSFIFSFISQFFIFFSYYFIIIALFNKFDNIKGFTLYEVLLNFSIVQFGYSFCELFARGVDNFDRLIISGNFDRLLLRPKNIMLQILISDVDFIKASRLIQSIIVLVISLINLKVKLTLIKVICLILMLTSSILLFFGIFVLAAAYCFWTVQGLEVRHVFTDGGKHIAQYPIGIFKKGVFYFFTFIIPYALVNYFPLLYFIGKEKSVLYAFCPLLVFIYLIPCFIVFKIGLKRYSSTGS